MVKMKVVELVNAMRVIKYFEEADNQKKLNFIAKDKLLSVLRYEDKLKNVEAEKEKFACAFGTEEYKMKNGEYVQIHENKLFKFGDSDKLSEFNDKTQKKLDVSALIKEADILLDFSTGDFVRAGSSFFKIKDMSKYNKYYQKLMETEVELLEARAFQADDLASMNELMIGDIALLGPLYVGNKEVKKDEIKIKIEKSDLDSQEKKPIKKLK